MFRAGTLSRVFGALFIDVFLHMILKMDDRVCTGPEVFTDTGFDIYTFISARLWVILEALKEFCLNGYVNLWGYVNGR